MLCRRLILMRHAESSDTAGRDHDRPITAQGAATARAVAAQLRGLGWLPQTVICSNALRTRQTYEEMRRELVELEDADVHFLGSLYAMAALDGETEAHLAVSARGRPPCWGPSLQGAPRTCLGGGCWLGLPPPPSLPSEALRLSERQKVTAGTCCPLPLAPAGDCELRGVRVPQLRPLPGPQQGLGAGGLHVCGARLGGWRGSQHARAPFVDTGGAPRCRKEATAPKEGASRLDPSPNQTLGTGWLLQGQAVKLGNSHAALLEGGGGSWEEAFAAEAGWSLASVVAPEGAA